MANEVSSGGLRATATLGLYVAECAMHRAQQSHTDAWVAAAAEMPHQAIRDCRARPPSWVCRVRRRFRRSRTIRRTRRQLNDAQRFKRLPKRVDPRDIRTSQQTNPPRDPEGRRDTDRDFTSGASVARRTTQRSNCGVTAARARVVSRV